MGEVVLMLAVGLAIGGVLGMLGGGGSILAVPALVYLGHQSPQAATTASLVVVGVGATGGLVPHLRDGDVRVGAGLAFGGVGVAGAFAGTRVNGLVSDDVLLAAFAGLMLVVAIGLFIRSRVAVADAQADGIRVWRVLVAGTGVGFLTGFLGVGGGFVVVPALVFALGLSMSVAVGTSLVVILVNVVAGLAARGPELDIAWMVTLALAAGTMAGAAGSGTIAHRFEDRSLTRAFALLLVVVASGIALSALS